MSRLRPLLWLAVAPVLPLAACDTDGTDDIRARATLAPSEGLAQGAPQVAGTITLREEGPLVTVEVDLRGAPPAGEHGLHVHAVGSCAPGADGAPAGAAGGHYDPDGTGDHGPHGGAGNHAGDLGNVTADASGGIRATRTTDRFSLIGDRSVVGRALVLHANRDDLETDPAGNAGARISCGVVTLVSGS